MSVTVGCVVEDEAAKEGGPRAAIILSAKSDAEAGECFATIKIGCSRIVYILIKKRLKSIRFYIKCRTFN